MINQEKSWVIYVLIDPRDGRVRYVGKTICLKKRLSSHIKEAMNGKKHNHRLHWIRDLVYSSFLPIGVILEIGIGNGWANAERKWIQTFKDAGASLVNGTNGGDGTDGHIQSQETRAKISLIHRGKTISPEHRDKLSIAGRKRFESLDARTKISVIHIGKHLSPEHRAKISIANRGKPKSLEHRMKMSTQRIGFKHTPEARVKISNAGRERKHSAETKAKISIANSGKQKSPEHRAKIVINNSLPERRARLSSALRGHICSPETRDKISATCLKKKHCES